MSLPAWAEVSPARRAHIDRVVALLDQWATAMHVSPQERERWLRAGWLHDALRDAPLGDPLAHGPLAAARAATDGETDRGVLDGVRYHTVGFAGWDDVGRMLYLADFLEPARKPTAATADHTQLAQRVPKERAAVLREVARRRIEWMLRSAWMLPDETVGFWNSLVGRPGR